MIFKTVKKKLSDIQAAMNTLTKTQVLIGIPASAPVRNPEPNEKQAPLNNATIGYLMEYGVPEKNIPARPHLYPGVESIMPDVRKRLRTAALAAIKGDINAVENAYEIIGLMGQNAVRGKITAGPFVPLAPRTLRARKAKGRTGERPLIDTGQLRAAYTYVVRTKS